MFRHSFVGALIVITQGCESLYIMALCPSWLQTLYHSRLLVGRFDKVATPDRGMLYLGTTQTILFHWEFVTTKSGSMCFQCQKRHVNKTLVVHQRWIQWLDAGSTLKNVTAKLTSWFHNTQAQATGILQHNVSRALGSSLCDPSLHEHSGLASTPALSHNVWLTCSSNHAALAAMTVSDLPTCS